MNNYFSSINSHVWESVGKLIREVLAAGNHASTVVKPTIIRALGEVPKPDSEDLIHDCSMPPGQGCSSYIEIENQMFQTLYDAVILGYYMGDWFASCLSISSW